MRNPALWRNVSLVFAVTGVAGCVLLFAQPDNANNGWKALLAIYAFTATIFGGISAIMRHIDVRAQTGLARGVDILARWTIDEFTWRDFVAMNEALNVESDGRYNEFDVSAVPDAQNIDVIVGKEAIDIAGQIFVLPRRGTPEISSAQLHESRVRPSYLELHLKYPESSGGASGTVRPATYSLLRFPVASSAVREARGVAAHYNGDVAGTADFFHGTGDGSDAEDLSRCWSCGFETHKFHSDCPRCGSSFQSRRWSRRFGLGLTICGAFITAVMGFVLYEFVPLLRHPGVDVNGTRFSGSASQALMVGCLLGAVFTLGASFSVYGAWQMRTGGRNKKVLYIIMPIFFGLILAALLM